MTEYQIKMTHKSRRSFFDFFSEIRFKFSDLDQIGEFAPSYRIQLQIFVAIIMSANE